MKGEINITSGFIAITTSLSKLPSMPILEHLPSLSRSFISLLNRCRVLVIPITRSQASSAMKFES
ncbi:hypothetical protein EVA_19234 [gut metagenome]|uniref:Uncharacterized protein n=1 Tax=gut metagenome TaxID=749906 RepID=J9BYM5_9ZZZZ